MLPRRTFVAGLCFFVSALAFATLFLTTRSSAQGVSRMIDRTVAQLATDLERGSPAERLETCQELASLGEDASPAALALVTLVATTSDDDLLEWAAEALENLGPPPTDTIERLQGLLGHAKSDAGYWAATLLGRLGASGSPAVPALVTALESSPHASVRERAAWALGEIGPGATAAVGPLEQAAQSGDARLTRLAQAALEQIGR
jgi:hypothetical protein